MRENKLQKTNVFLFLIYKIQKKGKPESPCASNRRETWEVMDYLGVSKLRVSYSYDPY